jgi:small subunit ribosomal protein S2
MAGADALDAIAKASGGNIDAPSSRMGNSVPTEQEDETDATINAGLEDADDMATKLDEVNNHESHRTREGRDIKATS